MKSKKFVIITALLLTVTLAIGAVFLGTELNKDTNVTPDTTKASTPLNCNLDKTTQNILNDTNMGQNNDGPYAIPEYCPGSTGKFKVTTSGKLFVYLSQTNLFVKINSQSFSNVNGFIDTNLIVSKGDYVSVWATTIPNLEAGVGWINPNGVLCGDTAWGTASIQPLLDKIGLNNHTVIERQCWGDKPKGSSDFDFDDFQIVLAVLPMSVTPSPSPVPTSTPTTQPTPIPTSAITLPVTYTPDTMADQTKVCGASSTCSSDANCMLGNSCINVSGTNRCVANICLTGGVVNSVCEADLCTAKQPISVEKTVSISCVTGQNKKQLSYTIVLTNPVGNANSRSNLTVVDTLDPSMRSEYVIRTSIPFGGSFNSGKITWNGLSLTPNGGRLEIKYNAIVPPSEFGKEYVNSVVVSENGTVRGAQTIKTKIEILPCTAIISDEVDRILIGGVLIILGIIMFRIGVDKKIGLLIWNRLGRTIDYSITGDYKGSLYKKDKKDFESRVSGMRQK